MNAPRSPLDDGGWDVVIEPHDRRALPHLGEVWRYRDLVLLLVHRDFVAQYKQTVLGPLWHLLQPLLTTAVLTVVFGHIAKLPTDGVPPFLFYMTGTVIWGYFAAVLNDTAGTFTANAGLLGKVYFPRLVIPVSTLLSKLIGFAIQFALLCALVAWSVASDHDVHPGASLLAVPLLVALMALCALALGIIVAALTTRYRDLGVLVAFGVQLLMFASPVVYPLSSVPDAWQPWLALNPVAPLIEAFRHALLGEGLHAPWMLAASAAIIIALLILGLWLFHRVERTFMDTL